MEVYLSTDGKYIYLLKYDFSSDKEEYDKYEVGNLSNSLKVFLYNNSKRYDVAKEINKDLMIMVGKSLKLMKIDIDIKLSEEEQICQKD